MFGNIQMEAAKKTYHMACKEEKLATAREANGKTEASVTPDQQKKLHEKVDKCKQDVQKVRRGRGAEYCIVCGIQPIVSTQFQGKWCFCGENR